MEWQQVTKNKKSKAKVLGMIKVWQQRLATYISIINFVMIFYLYIVESPMGLKWYHWGILISVAICVVLYFDIKYIFPNTQLYTFKKNPGWIAIKNQVDKNSEKLDKIMEKLEKY